MRRQGAQPARSEPSRWSSGRTADRPDKGRAALDGLITHRYSLDEVDQGYRGQAAGGTVRGLLVHAG